MTEVYPSYYPQFACRAGACRHTCCRGWEVDIDPETRERYRDVAGPLDAALCRSIIDGPDGAFFRMREDGRCPFLLESGLCQLILELGKDSLCQICTDHPRFRSFFSDRTELGVGLCCEAAAELVLSQEAPMELCVEGKERLQPDEKDLIFARTMLLSVAQNRDWPLDARMEELLERSGTSLPEWDGEEWFRIFSELERLEPDWADWLLLLKKAPVLQVPPELDLPGEQLLCYFLYRHLPAALEDGELPARVAFSVLLTRLATTLWTLGPEQSLPCFYEIARRISAEIEYSEENVDSLLLLLS